MVKASTHIHHTAPSKEALPRIVTIIHPNHPFCGQKVEIVGVMRRANPVLRVKFQDGTETTIDQDWTDYTTSPSESSSVSNSHLLDIRGLCEMITAVNRIKEQKDIDTHTA